MNLFLIKSGLSVLLLLLAGISTFTMLEVFGRSEKRYNIQTLKTIHKVSGIVYLLLFLCVAYLCVHYLVVAKSDLTPRNTVHVLFALSILALLSLKVLFVKVYRQFYPKVQTLGLALSLLTVGLFGFSGGFYLAVTEFGTDDAYYRKHEQAEHARESSGTGNPLAKTVTHRGDPKKGRTVFEEKCRFCHDPDSAQITVGPGLKGILKGSSLPASGKPATPENIALQLKKPLGKMPSFAHMTDEEVANVLAYLKTL